MAFETEDVPAAPHVLFDSHAHLDMEDFDPDRAEVLARARAAGVGKILCPMDIASARNRRLIGDLQERDENLLAAAGLHPHLAKEWRTEYASEIVALLRLGSIVALGEIGLDYHYDFSSPLEQRTAFRTQVALAETLGLPIIVHSRNAGADILRIVEEEKFSRGGILHCFTEDGIFAARMIERGFWISFSGIVTFPNAGDLRRTARDLPLERILFETDSPYLAPVPYRGRTRRNEPAFIAATARRLAEIRELPYAEFVAAAARNFAAFLAARFL